MGLGTLFLSSNFCLNSLIEFSSSSLFFNSLLWIGAWASKQSKELKNRDELSNSIKEFKQKFDDINNVPRPKHWSGWNLTPTRIEFWLDGDSRIHERLNYTFDKSGNWIKSLLSP